jgi:hypothetical protein
MPGAGHSELLRDKESAPVVPTQFAVGKTKSFTTKGEINTGAGFESVNSGTRRRATIN